MTDNIRIREATASDLECWLDMAHKLWPTSPRDELKGELTQVLDSDREFAAIVWLNDTPIGFMNLSLRYEYVPGAMHRPTAFLEGIYVEPPHRNRGVARRLVEYAEEWARSKGDAVVLALYVRYLKRIESHLNNIVSSVVNPFPRIGFGSKSRPGEGPPVSDSQD